MSSRNALFGRLQTQHLAVNNLIQWGDHLSVEDPAIDAQHKAIFDLGASVYESWRGGGGVEEAAVPARMHEAREERGVVGSVAHEP